MKYNMKYFEEHAVEVEGMYGTAYDLDEHRIGIGQCDRCSRHQYYWVCVDGVTVATRAKRGNTIRLALDYLNQQ